MELDERLRQLADRVPEPPPGDAAQAFRRGVGRRRARRGAGVTAVVALVAVLGAGVVALIDRPAAPDIVERPPASSPTDDAGDAAPSDAVRTQAPALTLAADEPFPWAVALSATDDGRWCATTTRGSTEPTAPAGQPCDEVLTLPEQRRFTWHGSRPDPSSDPTVQGLSWGLASADADAVWVELTDGTRRRARLSSDDAEEVALWAIAYEDVDIQEIEAYGDRWESGTVVLEGFDPSDALRLAGGLAAAVAVIAAGWWLRRRRRG